MTLARSRGAKQLSLGVYGSNRIARHIYDNMGFQVFEERVAEEDPSGVSYQMRLAL
jgi:ribosomal protein S18 acetylase RimI-like enzyme